MSPDIDRAFAKAPPGGWPEYTGNNLPPWQTEHRNTAMMSDEWPEPRPIPSRCPWHPDQTMPCPHHVLVMHRCDYLLLDGYGHYRHCKRTVRRYAEVEGPHWCHQHEHSEQAGWRTMTPAEAARDADEPHVIPSTPPGKAEKRPMRDLGWA